MIVCCPACQTQFKVDPALLKPDGRKVRCAKCAHVWRVRPDGTAAPTGQFALRAPKPESRQAAPPGPADEAKAAAAGAATAQSVPDAAEPASEEDVGTRSGDASDAPPAAEASPPKAEAGAAPPQPGEKKISQAAPRKGGRRFRIFLLVLLLVVLALLAAAIVTGRLGPGGVAPASRTPSTGDVAPPRSGTGFREPASIGQSRPAGRAMTRGQVPPL